MVFPNFYYKRTAATAKACYICYKPTATVLATIDTADFFYTCPVHLTDRGFATRAPEPEPEPRKPSVSPEEIAKVKQEWEEKQRQKKDKEKDKDKVQGKEGGQVDGEAKSDTEGTEGVPKDAEGKEADVGTKADSKQEKKPANAVIVPSASPSEEPTSRPTHERYVLHRDIFALRNTDHRRRRQAAQTKDLVPRLPGAPKSTLP
ncbi:DUF1742-domain-containing protein [Imleria badia]|nr:DUF1742-domain-containing protein [Imleria badia]